MFWSITCWMFLHEFSCKFLALFFFLAYWPNAKLLLFLFVNRICLSSRDCWLIKPQDFFTPTTTSVSKSSGWKMDDGRQHENGRHKMEYYRGAHSLVNRMHRFSGLSVCLDLYYWSLDSLIGLDFACAVEYWFPASSKRAKCTSYE